jgi:hypothetical protein
MDNMKIDKKESLWIDFLKEWDIKFNFVKGAFRLIKLYPERLAMVGLGNLLDNNQFDDSQKEWIWLYSRLENQIEIAYFNPYHVPINSDDYKVFIDLSKPEMPLFEPGYNWIEHCWDQLIRFESLMELIEYLESDDLTPPPIDKEFSKHLESLIEDIDLPELE